LVVSGDLERMQVDVVDATSCVSIDATGSGRIVTSAIAAVINPRYILYRSKLFITSSFVCLTKNYLELFFKYGPCSQRHSGAIWVVHNIMINPKVQNGGLNTLQRPVIFQLAIIGHSHFIFRIWDWDKLGLSLSFRSLMQVVGCVIHTGDAKTAGGKIKCTVCN
jgi:hypothetical protein